MNVNKVVNPNLNTNNVITISHLDVVFNPKTSAEYVLLKDINFQFNENKVYFIIGESGSGKTTLITHLNGIMKSKFGDIFVKEYAILGKKRKIKQIKKLRKVISMVLQFPEYQLFKETVEKDIMFGPVNLGVDKKIAQEKAKFYLNKMGLDDSYLQKSPFALSGGQKRRVAIAGILAIEPDILIFDEPTAGLDPNGEREMLNIITELKKNGKTVIVVSHKMDHALAIGDEIIVLKDHKIFAHAKPYDIFTNSKIINSSSRLLVPKVIDVINKLVKINPKFNILFKLQPKNVHELAKMLAQISFTQG
ncbi:ATP-binding cassette domain-containing protein [bacterium]|nr:ATP-binding cassette domain-containing protein [bacterium]